MGLKPNFIVAYLLLICLTTLALMHEPVAVAALLPLKSCSELPYPQACESLVHAADPLFAGSKANLGFREFNIQGALDGAQRAQLQAASAVALASSDPRAKAAWSDCLELSQDAVENLRRSLVATSSSEDSQTWLSAAAASQQTCLNGFADFNLPVPSGAAESIMSFLSANMTRLVSNSLAVNKESMSAASTLGGNRKLLSAAGGFPEWVSAADRKLLQASTVRADVVVAKDGSGNFRTISEAVAAASKSGGRRFVIHVKAGVYAENVEVPKTTKNLMIVGDGMGNTIVTGRRSVQDGSTTFRSATFGVMGSGFIARDITFENTAGPQKHQAVAFRSGSDFSVLYRCGFKGYQDTLYVYSQRQFYRECNIYGTVDFIFGDAVAVLQNCNIFVRRPMSGQKNTITAQGRSDPNENTGISIHNSVVTASSDLKPVQGSIKTYLGRPWKQYSRTVFMKTNLDSLITPAGWLEWSGNFALSTLYYGEYMNTGAGAGTGGRVKWPGYRVITNAAEAGKFTVGSFLSGGSWISATGVPFTAGL